MVTKKPISECDAGDVAVFKDYIGSNKKGDVWGSTKRGVIMSIKAPRGRILIFGPVGDGRDDCRCDGIRAFVEQHSKDGDPLLLVEV